MLNPLSSVQITKIETETQRYIDLANQVLQVSIPPIEIYFNVSGATWGYFVRRQNQQVIRYNPYLFEKHYQEGLTDTIPHEVAHYVVDCLYAGKRIKPHGPEWRKMMILFGVDHPKATHNTDLTGIPRRRQRRFDYQCGCKVIPLSTTRHYRIQSGRSSYRCGECGEKLRLKR